MATNAGSTTLYELAEMREILDGWLSESEGELTPELEALLNEHNERADEKIERVALYIREQLAQAKAIKEEEERLSARRKAREKAAESLRQYLHRQMESLGKTEVKGLLATVKIQQNPPAVQSTLTSDDLERIFLTVGDSDLVRYIPPSYALDKVAVSNAVKNGRALPEGISLVRTAAVRIR